MYGNFWGGKMQKKDRDYIFLELTRSICPVCRIVIDAQVLAKDNKVYMKKRCQEHGLFESLISSDAERYMNAYKFNKPGTMPLEFGTEIKEGCPLDCGLCPDHQQHSCVGIIEITNACNLRCPTCFASSEGHDFLDVDTVNFMLDQFVKYEGDPEVVQFSGGEPTIHPKILDIIELATKKNIKYVMINTNGIKISKDEEFTKKLADLGAVIYLQFDGFKKETYEKIRGEDLLQSKLKAIQNMEKFGVDIILVATVQRNVNEDEMGKIVDFALSKPSIKGVVFQPTFYSGRHPDFDPMNVVTLPEVVKNISGQSKYDLKESDFIPIPCCFPTCGSATYVYMDENEAKPLPRMVDVEDYLDFIKNKTVPDPKEVKEALQALFSFGAVGGSEKTVNSFCSVCNIPSNLEGLQDKIKVIMIQPFMDPYNFDIKKLMKCCIHEITPTGKIVPFCAFNNIPKYRAEVNKFFASKRLIKATIKNNN